MSGFVVTPSALDPADAVYSEIILAGESWIHPIAEGQTFRIVDLEGKHEESPPLAHPANKTASQPTLASLGV